MDRLALRSAAEAAVKQGEERLREFERDRGKMLPPSPSRSKSAARAVFRAHYFALMKSLDYPDLYSAILQDFLEAHEILLPRGVFKRDFCAEYRLPQPPLSPYDSNGNRGILLPARKRGRPRKDQEAQEITRVWLENGKPSFGKLVGLILSREELRALSRSDHKKLADRYRQQVYSCLK